MALRGIVRTAKGDSEQRIAVIAVDEQVEHDSRRARDHHRGKKWCPAFLKERPDLFVL